MTNRSKAKTKAKPKTKAPKPRTKPRPKTTQGGGQRRSSYNDDYARFVAWAYSD